MVNKKKKRGEGVVQLDWTPEQVQQQAMHHLKLCEKKEQERARGARSEERALFAVRRQLLDRH